MRVLSWNMAAGFGHNTSRHDSAWRWLADNGPDIALLQEAIAPTWAPEHWAGMVFAPYYKGKRWGSAIVSRRNDLRPFVPSDITPWLTELWGSTVVGFVDGPAGIWVASIHSNAYPVSIDRLAQHPHADIRRCHPTGVWEIELVSHELAKIFAGAPFVAGGDLNSGLLFDTRNRYNYNAVLFQNMADDGFCDLRRMFHKSEQQTFFKARRAAYQLDHVFGDAKTAAQAQGWRVIPEPAVALGLSDHAPIEVILADP